MTRPKLVLYGLLIFVCLIWGANMLATIFNPNYKAPPELNGGFTFIAAGLLGAIAKSNGANRGGGGSHRSGGNGNV